jgi:dihydrolipoamide dehydrogenase
MKKYDVVIIGAGSAGLSAQKEVAAQTDNYLVVDHGPTGTICARVGCMPSKALIEAANCFHERKKFALFGANFEKEPTLDTGALMEHVRGLRDRFVRSVDKGMEPWVKTHFRTAQASFLSPTELLLDGEEKILAARVIVATGSVPTIFPDWEPVKDFLLTTDTIFELPALPEKMAVLGVGPIGLELGQALARLGVAITVFGKGPSVGGLQDEELKKLARKTIGEDLKIVNADVDGIELRKDGHLDLEVGGEKYSFPTVLAAVGRTPAIKHLNLQALGQTLNKKGMPELDQLNFQVPGTEVYFAGDVNGIRPVLHEANDQGRITGKHPGPVPRCRTKMTITFTAPQIATVGQSEKELKKAGVEVAVGQASFEGQGRALTKMEAKGMVKVFGSAKCGRILGAELFCPAAEHLAHLLCWAMESELNVFNLLDRPVYHPTLEEGLRTALRELSKKVKEQPKGPWHEMRCQDAPVGP